MKPRLDTLPETPTAKRAATILPPRVHYRVDTRYAYFTLNPTPLPGKYERLTERPKRS